MDILSNDHHNDLVKRLTVGFNALLEQVQDLEFRLSRITDEAQDLLQPESPVTYASSLNSLQSEQNERRQSAKQLNSVESHQATRLKNRSHAIWEGKQALDALNACSFSKILISESKNTESSQSSAGRYETYSPKPAAHSLKDLDPNNASKCPFASLNSVSHDPKVNRSSFESITPRPDSVMIPQAHLVETSPTIHKNASPDQSVNPSDDLNSPRIDRQKRLSSHQHHPISLTHQDLSTEDPIAAECRPAGSCVPPSVSGSVSASKCPIRFFDQHSPEEIAAYFENHKHEIPRSHEICVKRYQSNEQSIRQLDAKYGDLVSMIQGLGMKHQPLLRTEDDEEIPAAEQNLLERVEKWTDEIRRTPEESRAEILEAPADARGNHFDRPLKDVRLGESPSRPWGISVPAAANPSKAPTSPTSTGNFSVSSIKFEKDKDVSPGNPIPKKPTSHLSFPSTSPNPPANPPFSCPHPLCSESPTRKFPTLQQLALHLLDTHSSEDAQQEQRSPPPSPPASRPSPAPIPASGNSPPQIVFTGPIFMGYPLDQAAIALQQYGLGFFHKAQS